MRSRSTLFLFAFLLLTASLAGAAMPAGMSSPATDVAPSPEDPSCNPLLAKLGISDLDPTASAQSASTYVCGACSEAICRGQALGALCSATKRCQWISAFECPQDNQANCRCWGGQLP